MTATNKSAAEQNSNQKAVESGSYQMIDKNGNCYPIDESLEEIIHEGFVRITDRVNIKDFLDATNMEIIDAYETAIAITGDLGDITIKAMSVAHINNIERLRVVLGEDFEKLVSDKEIAKYELIEIACDADDPRALEVRGCITIKKLVEVTWELKS